MTRLALSALVALAVASAAHAQVKLVPAPHQGWTNAFAESKPELEFTVQAPAGFRGRLAWALAEVETRRILPRGRGEAAVAGGQKVKVALELPPVNPGVMLK